jgi:hypothetical protein
MHLPFEPPLEPCSPRPPPDCRTATAGSTSRSGMGSARSSSATRDEVLIQSRDLKPLDRYFPELAEPIRRCSRALRRRRRGRDRPATASSQFERCSCGSTRGVPREHARGGDPASFVAWDLLALGTRTSGDAPGRTARPPETAFGGRRAPIHLTPRPGSGPGRGLVRPVRGRGSRRGRREAARRAYQPGKRAMLKIKHQRTADCVVAGFRWHKNGPGTHVGRCCSGCSTTTASSTTSGSRRRSRGTRARRSRGAGPLRERRARRPPVAGVGRVGSRGGRRSGQRLPGATSAGTAARTCRGSRSAPSASRKVAYDHSRAIASGHATTFQRWRPDKAARGLPLRPARGDAAYELAKIFGG